MDVQVLAVRNLTYRMFVDGGRGPTVDEVAREGDLTSAEVEASWRELHRAHALVLEPHRSRPDLGDREQARQGGNRYPRTPSRKGRRTGNRL